MCWAGLIGHVNPPALPSKYGYCISMISFPQDASITRNLPHAFYEEMRPAPRSIVSAPSSSVLGILRFQSEQACLHTFDRSALAYQTSSGRGAEIAIEKVAHALPSIKRRVATTSRHQFPFESSLLNLDFLRPNFERGSSRLSAPAIWNSPGPFGFPSENSNSSRYASTDTRPLWKRPWMDKMRKEKPALKSNDSTALPNFLDDAGSTNFGRRKTVKGANELKIRCTEFGENGRVTFMDGEFKKSELIAKVCPMNLMS